MYAIKSTSYAVPMLEIYANRGSSSASSVSPPTTSYTTPKNTLCQHAAGFSLVDATFSKHFSPTAMQRNNTNSQHKFTSTRKPTHSF